VSPIGLRYTEDENTIEWEKRKLEYSPAIFLKTNFQDLLKSECENNCSFLFALHPENINKEILSGIGSAHIFVDQEIMMLELRYKQYAEEFNHINTFQKETGLIAKKDGPKVCRLFKLFCLKDRGFNSLVKREKKVKPASIEVMVNTQSLFAMEIENGLELPDYTNTEILMDDLTSSPTKLMNRFEKFQGG